MKLIMYCIYDKMTPTYHKHWNNPEKFGVCNKYIRHISFLHNQYLTSWKHWTLFLIINQYWHFVCEDMQNQYTIIDLIRKLNKICWQIHKEISEKSHQPKKAQYSENVITFTDHKEYAQYILYETGKLFSYLIVVIGLPN